MLTTAVARIQSPCYYVVDIGASSGVPSDPVYPYITNPTYSGLCIEGKQENANILLRKLSNKFLVSCKYVTPQNILEIFQSSGVPKSPDILKIDIDGYDLEVLRVILTEYTPKIIIAEINEKIPPPIEFEVLYRDTYVWDESHCFGFSIASGEKVMKQHGYRIVEVHDLNNILCVRNDVDIPSVGNNIYEIYEKGYKENHQRFTRLPWNSDVDYWLRIKDHQELKSHITTYFTTNNSRSKFSTKTKQLGVDFSISL
jgi:hypothetical protein